MSHTHQFSIDSAVRILDKFEEIATSKILHYTHLGNLGHGKVVIPDIMRQIESKIKVATLINESIQINECKVVMADTLLQSIYEIIKLYNERIAVIEEKKNV